jgi:tetratricopeptide (TPR) repeat protein
MIHRLTQLTALIAGCLTTAATAATPPAQPPRAKITLQTDRALQVELLGFASRDMIRLRDVTGGSEAGIGVRDIKMIEFEFEFDRAEIERQYHQTRFKQTAETLWAALRPCLPYIELPNNASEYLSMMLSAMYWNKQYQELGEATAGILSFSRNEPLRLEARLMRVLALVAQGRVPAAREDLAKVPADNAHDNIVAMRLFAEASIHVGEDNWDQALQTLARLVAFHGKNFDWMPPALVLLARAYARAGRYEVADQIVSELQMISPRTHWTDTVARHKREWDKTRPAAPADNDAPDAVAGPATVAVPKPPQESAPEIEETE